MGSRSKKGYGTLNPDTYGDPQAHRVSYIFNVGPIPAGLWVLHHCDNPPCVNPDHLFLGNNRDNVLDSSAKGRRHGSRNTGEDNAACKLSAVDVSDIRRRLGFGEMQKTLSVEYGVSKASLCRIATGKQWKRQ
jgi:hypothetical protein